MGSCWFSMDFLLVLNTKNGDHDICANSYCCFFLGMLSDSRYLQTVPKYLGLKCNRMDTKEPFLIALR